MMRFAPCVALVVAIMFSTANRNTTATEKSAVITFPPSTAQKWILPNGLPIIVQEDHSAPVASVPAWCAPASINEDQHIAAGLSQTQQPRLLKCTKARF